MPVSWMNLKKSLTFAAMGTLGCFLAALLLGEPLLALLLPSPVVQAPKARPVDVLFALDRTGSMGNELSGLKESIQSFAAEFAARSLEARIGLLTFGDRSCGEEPEVLRIHGETFTQDMEAFRNGVAALSIDGGGDEPESSMDALSLASQSPFAPDAIKVVILITDAPPKEPPSLEVAQSDLMGHGIDYLHLVIRNADRASFQGLQNSIKGEIFELPDNGLVREGFDRSLPAIGQKIAEGIRTGSPLASKVEDSFGRIGSLLAATSLWTGVLAVGICLALQLGQNRHLNRPMTPIQGITGTLGSMLVGMTAGAVGQILYAIAAVIPGLALLARILAWAMLGGLLGGGTSFFIPNLRPMKALAGGGLGGVLGAIGFVAAAHLGDTPARLLGAALLGGFIGMMVALAEAASRDAWLEIAFHPNATGLVNLGSKPVTVGSDPKRCTLCIPDAPPVAGRFWMERGTLMFEDPATGRSRVIKQGQRSTFGTVAITVQEKNPPKGDDCRGPV